MRKLLIASGAVLVATAAVIALAVATNNAPATAPAPTHAAAYPPPTVVVDPGVQGVDQAAAQAFVARVVNDPRSWRVVYLDATIHITPLANAEAKCGARARACAGSWLGPNVLIADSEWKALNPAASPGVTLADQRAWYVNHELGHLLGHSHSAGCPGDGGLALVMRPYAYVDGCTFNAWPFPGQVN